MTKLKNTAALILGALIILANPLSTATAGESRNLKDVYNDSVKQFDAGQYQEALKGFELVLKNQPRYVYARNYAVKCRNAIADGKTPEIDLEKQLAAIRIPSIDFNKTDLGSALEYLSQKCEEISGGKIAANFIYQGTEEDRKTRLITLKLTDVPITEVINYVGRLTGTKFKFEQYAVVGTPVGATASAAEVQPVKAADNKLRFDASEVAKDPFKKK